MATAQKVKLTTSEKIDRYRDGRSQKWIIEKLKDYGVNLSEAQFSTKKKGDLFSGEELDALVSILPGFTH